LSTGGVKESFMEIHHPPLALPRRGVGKLLWERVRVRGDGDFGIGHSTGK